MKTKDNTPWIRLMLATFLIGLSQLSSQAAMSTAFAYQGRLTAGGAPANTVVDLQLKLFDMTTGGTQIGPTLTNQNVTVTNGLFNTSVNFGTGIFDGTIFWLETAIRPASSSGGFSELTPRQPISGAPFAFFASNAGAAATAMTATMATAAGAVPWTGIVGIPPGFADNMDNDTTYSAGPGLSQVSDTVFGVDFGGNGTAMTVSRSDHFHTAPLPDHRLTGTYTQVLRLNNAANQYVGIGSGLTALDASNVTLGILDEARIDSAVARDSEILSLVTGVDGPGSGVDADTVDGLQAADFWQLSGNAGTTAGVDYLGTTDNEPLEFKVDGQRAMRLEPDSRGPNVIGGSPGNSVGAFVYAATIAGGLTNVINESLGTIGGGSQNIVLTRAPYATIPGGLGALARRHGQMAHASGFFSAPGDAQTSVYMLRNITTGTATTDLFLDGDSDRLFIATGQRWVFNIHVVASDNGSSGLTGGWRIQGVIKNVAGTVSFVGGSATVTTIATDEPGWTVSAVANDARNTLEVHVTGLGNNPIRWVARVETVEVDF